MSRPKSAFTTRIASARRPRPGIDLTKRPDLSRFLTSKTTHNRTRSEDFKVMGDVPLMFKPKEDCTPQRLDKFNNAFRLRAEGLFEAAEVLFNEILLAEPENTPARLNLGVCYMKLGRFTEAQRLYKDTGVYTSDARLAYNLALCFIMTFAFEEALTVLQSIAKSEFSSEVQSLLRFVDSKIANGLPTEVSFVSDVTVDDEDSGNRSYSRGRPKTGAGYKDVSSSTADHSDEPCWGMWKIFKSVEQYGGDTSEGKTARVVPMRKPPRAKSARAKVEFTHPKSSFLTAAKVTRPSDSSNSCLSYEKGPSPESRRRTDEVFSPMPKRYHVDGPLTQESLEDDTALKSAVPSRRQESLVFAKIKEARTIIDGEERKVKHMKNLLPNVDVSGVVKDRLSVSALEFIRREMAKPQSMRDYDTMIGLLAPLKFFAKFQKDVRVEILRSCTHYIVHSNDYVYRQKDLGSTMFIILSGSVVVEKKSGEYGEDKLSLRTIFDGETFGEVSLLSSDQGEKEEPRSASIRCLEETDLLALGKSEYHRLMMSQMHTDIDSKIRFFSSHPLFSGAQRLSLVPLVTNIDVTCYRFGQTIVQAGAVPQAMYLIYSGFCQIYAEGYALRPRSEGMFARSSRRPHPKFTTGSSKFTASAKPPDPESKPAANDVSLMRAHFRNTNFEKVLKDHYFAKELTRLETLQPGDFFCGRSLTTCSPNAAVAPAKYTIVAESAEVQVYVLTQVHLGFLGEGLEVNGRQRTFKAVVEKKGDPDCPAEISEKDIDCEFIRWSKYKHDLMDSVRRARFMERNKDQIISALRDI